MRTYKVHFIDGKTFNVAAEEKLTQKKLSAKYLSFTGSPENSSRLFLNSDNILMIEEIKEVKKKTGGNAAPKRKRQKAKTGEPEIKTTTEVRNNPPL